MALGFIVIGTLLAIVGFVAALRPGSAARRRRRPGGLGPEQPAADAEPGSDAKRAQALTVLQEPIAAAGGFWSGLAEAGPPRQFKIGLFVGLGAGLAVSGLLIILFPAGGSDPALRPPASAGAPQVAGKAAATPAPAGGTGQVPVSGKADVPAPTGSGGQAAAAGKTAATPAAPPPTAPAPPPTAAGDPVLLTVQPGENAVLIANHLVELGIISSRQAFLDRVAERQADVRLQAGQFRLRRGMAVDAVIDVLAP